MTVPLLDEGEREWWNETDLMGMGKAEHRTVPNIADPDSQSRYTKP